MVYISRTLFLHTFLRQPIRLMGKSKCLARLKQGEPRAVAAIHITMFHWFPVHDKVVKLSFQPIAPFGTRFGTWVWLPDPWQVPLG